VQQTFDPLIAIFAISVLIAISVLFQLTVKPHLFILNVTFALPTN